MGMAAWTSACPPSERNDHELVDAADSVESGSLLGICSQDRGIQLQVPWRKRDASVRSRGSFARDHLRNRWWSERLSGELGDAPHVYRRGDAPSRTNSWRDPF